MRAGTLDRKITIQRKTTVLDSSGEPMETWTNLAANRWAAVTPILGFEVFGSEQQKSRQQVNFEVRWSPDLVDLSPLDRIVYPAASATESPSQANNIYDIIIVNELKRHQNLQIITARQPDVPVNP